MGLPPFQYLFAGFLPAMFIGVFIGAMLNPHSLCTRALFPQPAKKPLNIFFYIFAVRELVLGVALLILEVSGEWRAATVLVACLCLNGLTDFYFAGSLGAGWWNSFTKHGVPRIIGLWSAWNLWQEHWAGN